MCFTLSPLAGLRRWNWDGGRIVRESVVPAGRTAIGHAGKKHEYPIDVREFLVTDRNEVLRRTLQVDLPAFARDSRVRPDLLTAREAGTFDLRAAMVAAFVAHRVAYRPAGKDEYWQFPDETLSLKGGDCEDRALLIAGLLIASGVSSFNVRVAFGKIRLKLRGRASADLDHAWAMYKSEAGRWQVLEPMIARRSEARHRKKARLAGLPRNVERAEYVPHHLFNDVHLWEVAHPSPLPSLAALARRRRGWKRLRPDFAGEVHRSILTEALGIPQCPPWFLASATSHFSTIFRQVVDDQDNFVTHGYDCKDHFDDAFIEESWDLAAERLARFRADNAGNIEAFCGAAHAIADFYAHSSYAHFADDGSRTIPVARPEAPLCGLGVTPDYGGGSFDFSGDEFTTAASWTAGHPAAARAWAGRIVSGRYAQHGDSQSTLEALTATPGYLDNPGDRAAVPHHDEIAVDGDKSSNTLYALVGEYQRQFVVRRDAAVAHIRKAFLDNWTQG